MSIKIVCRSGLEILHLFSVWKFMRVSVISWWWWWWGTAREGVRGRTPSFSVYYRSHQKVHSYKNVVLGVYTSCIAKSSSNSSPLSKYLLLLLRTRTLVLLNLIIIIIKSSYAHAIHSSLCLQPIPQHREQHLSIHMFVSICMERRGCMLAMTHHCHARFALSFSTSSCQSRASCVPIRCTPPAADDNIAVK